jgi:hypothetical protein
MKVPEGIENCKNKVCKLKKSLYGIRILMNLSKGLVLDGMMLTNVCMCVIRIRKSHICYCM